MAQVVMVVTDVLVYQEGIKAEDKTIKTLLTCHHKLMSDIRAILKTLAKVRLHTCVAIIVYMLVA